MHSVKQLQTKQVGLRLPTYLLDEINQITQEHSVNRTDIISEAVRSYIEHYKEEKMYGRLDGALKEVKLMQEGKIPSTTLEDLIDELDTQENTKVWKICEKAC